MIYYLTCFTCTISKPYYLTCFTFTISKPFVNQSPFSLHTNNKHYPIEHSQLQYSRTAYTTLLHYYVDKYIDCLLPKITSNYQYFYFNTHSPFGKCLENVKPPWASNTEIQDSKIHIHIVPVTWRNEVL